MAKRTKRTPPTNEENSAEEMAPTPAPEPAVAPEPPTNQLLDARFEAILGALGALTEKLSRVTEAPLPSPPGTPQRPLSSSSAAVSPTTVMSQPQAEEAPRQMPQLTIAPVTAGLSIHAVPEWPLEKLTRVEMEKFSLKYTQYRRGGGTLLPDQCLTKGFRDKMSRAWREYVRGTSNVLDWESALQCLKEGRTEDGKPFVIEDWFEILELVIHLEESGGKITKEDSFTTLIIHRDPVTWLCELDTFSEACERNFRTTTLPDEKIKEHMMRAVSQAALTNTRTLQHESLGSITARGLFSRIEDEIFEENRRIKIHRATDFSKLPGARKRDAEPQGGDQKRHKTDDSSRSTSTAKRGDSHHEGRGRKDDYRRRDDHYFDDRRRDTRRYNDRYNDRRREDYQYDDRRNDRRTDDRDRGNRRNEDRRQDYQRRDDTDKESSWAGVYNPRNSSTDKKSAPNTPRTNEESNSKSDKPADRRTKQ